MEAAGGPRGEAAEAARLREENERLRAENDCLRAAVLAARPGTPLPPPTPLLAGPGGTAAERLARLMREGGQLLLEREELRAEGALLAADFAALVEAYESDNWLVAEEALARTAPPALPRGAGRLPRGEGEDLAELDRLLPLLSEADHLRAEQAALVAEQQELCRSLGAADGAACLTDSAPPTRELDVLAEAEGLLFEEGEEDLRQRTPPAPARQAAEQGAGPRRANVEPAAAPRGPRLAAAPTAAGTPAPAARAAVAVQARPAQPAAVVLREWDGQGRPVVVSTLSGKGLAGELESAQQQAMRAALQDLFHACGRR